MIEIDNITYFYKQNQPIFSDFSLSIEDNQTWSILGPSGCGKTTLLYLISGLYQPQNGEIRINGKVINRPDPSVGLIIQEYGLLPWATVRDNAQLGVQIREFYGPDGKHAPRDAVDHKSVDGWLERLGLLKLADQYPSQISGGQRQRTAIARTLVLEPNVLLMDEPFSSLDAPTRDDLQKLTLNLQDETGLILITVTHSIETAAQIGEYILLLSDPPNKQPQIFYNPDYRTDNYSYTQSFKEITQKLRSRMEK